MNTKQLEIFESIKNCYLGNPSKRVILNYLLGKRKSCKTSSFVSICQKILQQHSSSISQINPAFALITSRLNTLNKLYNSNITYTTRQKKIDINDELSHIYEMGWKDVKEKYFDNSFFVQFQNEEFEDMSEDKLKYYQNEFSGLEEYIFKI